MFQKGQKARIVRIVTPTTATAIPDQDPHLSIRAETLISHGLRMGSEVTVIHQYDDGWVQVSGGNKLMDIPEDCLEPA